MQGLRETGREAMEKKLSKAERELLDSIVKHAAGRKRVRSRTLARQCATARGPFKGCGAILSLLALVEAQKHTCRMRRRWQEA